MAQDMKVTKTTELSPEQARSIIKEYFERQGQQAARVDFKVGAQPTVGFEDYGVPVQALLSVVVTQEETAPGIALPASTNQANDLY